MKKSFKLQDLDCANCAAKMEHNIGRIEGVISASVNFMAQRLTLEAPDAEFDRVLEEAEKAIRKVDSDCVLVR